MKWTKEAPTVSGWYWLRQSDGSGYVTEVRVVDPQICGGHLAIWDPRDGEWYPHRDPDAEWAGPIPEPMADQTKHALDNAERVLEHEGIYCVRKSDGGRWVLESTDGSTVSGGNLRAAFEGLRLLRTLSPTTVGDET